MRISDVSSDVCSSDLRGELIGRPLWDASWWRDDAAVRDQVREMVARAQEGHASRADIVVHVDDQNPVTIDFQLVPIVEHATVTQSEEHTSELQSLMRISYAVFCLKKKTKNTHHKTPYYTQT